MQGMKKAGVYLLLMMCGALLLTMLPLFSGGGTVAVAANSDWTEVNVPGANNVIDIEAVDINTAWAVGTIPGGGGIILKTTDGGVTWNVQKTLTASWPAQALSSISVVDANTAWASGYRTLLKTTDGGANWDVVYYSTSMYEGVPDVCAVDANNAWAILIDATLTSYIFKTSDGGATWVKLYTRPYSSGIIGRLSAVDSTTAWAVGGGLLSGPSSTGTIIKTSDMGATWQEQTPTGAPAFLNVLARDASNAWVAGNGTVMRTTDGGASWATMYTMAGTELWGIAASDASTIWVAGKASSTSTGGCIVKTVDEGSTWQTLYSTSSYGLYCVSSLDAANAWAGGQNTTASNSVILHTVNGGDARPDIAEMAPFSGQAGDTVIITGCDFGADRGTSIVSFGGSEAASYTLWSNGEIRVTVPAGLSGSCKVTVTTAAGASNTSSFLTTYPISVTSIEPASGLQFTISLETKLTGSSFLAGATVRFMQDTHVMEAYNVNVVSANELTCTVGLFGVEPGIYDVTVTNPDGGVATLTGAFTVNAACGSGAGTAAVALGCTLGLLSLGHNLNRRRRR
jgi:photosystem II stability/assembly factor-like uncharacterized protein